VKVRVGIVADLAEEGWPSMDLAAEMLAREFNKEATQKFSAEIVRPKMHRRFSKESHGSGFTLDRALNRFFDYPRAIRRRRSNYDLFHIVDHSYSHLVHELPANRAVVTCHDLDTFRCLWQDDHGGRGILFRAMTRRILSGFKKAAHVCCDSAATRDEILARKLLPPEKTSVVPLGVDSPFFQSPGAETSASVAAMLKDDSSTSPIYLLHVGSVIARKRVDVLLEIFARLHRTNPHLRLLRVGGPLTAQQQSQAERLGIGNAIRVLPFLSTEQLAAVYQCAALLLLPSDAEGFGFPVIEAMAGGTPVVASGLPVMREVGGDAAIYAGVGKIDMWVERIFELLGQRQNDPAAWKSRSERCRAQAAKFSWNETARRTAEVYERVLTASESTRKR
jgi:glycosyltransferase involved in cell wall biosynthesis